MKQRNLLIAALLLLALSGTVWYAKRHPKSDSASTTSSSTNPKVAEIPDAQVQSIDLTKKDGSSVTIARQNGKWSITTPQKYPADQDASSAVASALNPLTGDDVVENRATDLARFGLANPSLTVTVHEKSGKTDSLKFGDDEPTGSMVYAQYGSTPKIYAVSSSVKSSFDKSVNDLRDKRLLTFDSNQLTRVELTGAKSDIEFGKNGQNEWQILKPQAYRADSFQVEELLRKLSDAKMDLSGSANDTKKAAAAFNSGQPTGTVKVSDAAGTQILQIHKSKDDYYAQSSVVPGAYKISADLGKQVDKSLDDFRNKKLFDFGFSDPNKIDVQQGGIDKVFVRSGTDWKSNGAVMDAGKVQSLIDKLRDVAATKFVDSGFTMPAVTISVESNDGRRKETAELAKVSDGYIARRGNEPALYQLDAKAVNDILEATNAIKPSGSAKKK